MQKYAKITNIAFLNELFVNYNYSFLERSLLKSDSIAAKEKLAFLYLTKGDYMMAASLYEQLKMKYHHGYAHLLGGDINVTKKIWNSLDDSSPLHNWGKSLLGFINLYVEVYPSFFQIRDFLELDLNKLLVAGKLKYVENIINGLNVYSEINPESHKYVARVLFNHKYYEFALKLLDESLDIYYKDPETHILKAKCYTYLGNNLKAKISANKCLNIAPEYVPAKHLLHFLDS